MSDTRDIVEGLRLHGSTLRTNSLPLSALIPLLNQAADEITRLRAALSQPVPAGWKLVPVEPTEAMELEGMRALRSTPRTVTGASSREQAWTCYRAMLAAAPQPGAQDG